MTPIYTAPALVRSRHEELLAEAGRRRLLATAPRDPGILQRVALRGAGWGRRPGWGRPPGSGGACVRAGRTLSPVKASPVAKRREARTAQIVAVAWTLAREHGIAGGSLHSLVPGGGGRQPSLYE